MSKWYTVIKEGDPNEGLTLEQVFRATDEGVSLRESKYSWRYYYSDEVEPAEAPDESYVDTTSILPDDAKARKCIPVYSGLVKYFPDAFVAVARHSYHGGLQHGQTPETLHWDRSKSTDHLDALMRHILDEDWEAVAWRALAHLQTELEKEKKR